MSASPQADGSSNPTFDLLDLNDIFAGDFYPQEVDFTNLEWDTDHQFESYSPMPFASPESSAAAVSSNDGSSHSTVQIPPAAPTQRDIYVAVNKRKGQLSASKSAAKNAKSAADNAADEASDGDDSAPEEAGVSAKRGKSEAGSVSTGRGTGDRRERNRKHAKQSRSRKRIMLDALSDQLTILREQNARLRSVVAEKIPAGLAAQLLSECTTQTTSLLVDSADINYADELQTSGEARPVPSSSSSAAPQSDKLVASSSSTAAAAVPGSSSSGAAVKILMQPDYRLIQSLVVSQQNFILTDPSLPDNPIVYASDGFCKLTGYKRGDILGRNCRFLQGPGTDQVAVGLIRKGIQEDRDVSVCLLNYKADGTPFWNQFFLGALKDSANKVVNFVGVQCEVNIIPVTELKDRVKRLPIVA